MYDKLVRNVVGLEVDQEAFDLLRRHANLIVQLARDVGDDAMVAVILRMLQEISLSSDTPDLPFPERDELRRAPGEEEPGDDIIF